MQKKSQIIKILKAGGIGVMPTDTIYGLVGQALNKHAVERIYRVRKRQPDKPLIILISSYDDLKLFGVELNQKDKKILDRFWPGQVSVILPCARPNFSYLHRGTKTLAFRLPDKKWLRDLIKQTGPLVAPSANPEGERPAKNSVEAKNYFGEISLTPLNPPFRKGGKNYFLRQQKNILLPFTKGEVGRGLKIDFYYGRGDLVSLPSTLVKLENNKIEILRQGRVKIKK